MAKTNPNQANEVIAKTPTEVIQVDFDYSKRMATAETITTLDSVTFSPAGPTSSGLSQSGQIGQCLISAGADATDYICTGKCTTSLSQQLELAFLLKVRA